MISLNYIFISEAVKPQNMIYDYLDLFLFS